MRVRLLCLFIPVVAACTVEGTDPVDGSERGALGKADLVGSCELPNGGDKCGTKGTGNCWCDEACVDFGDCCSDAGEVCGIEPPPPEGEACGGLLGLTCAEDEFCFYTPEQMCGAADHTGICTPRPEACIQLFDPVCGCDGQTYSNACMAASAGTAVASEGECEEPSGQFCGGFAGIQCPDGQTCIDDPNDDCDPENGGADCGGICVPDDDGCGEVLCALFCENGFATDENGCEICECADPQPEPCHVAGCSGELCVGPDGPEFSICIFEPWYECLALTQCGNFGPADSCGWEPNDAYLDCLAQHGL